MIKYLPVQGTWETRTEGSWSLPSSPLSAYLEPRGLHNLSGDGTIPYAWSTDLDFAQGDHQAWIAGGKALFYYLVPPLNPAGAWPPAETVIVTHSHGLQVALYAAALGLKIDRLLTFMGPVRKDMMSIAEQARKNIRSWRFVRSDESDRWQWFGELFDGHLGVVRNHPLADINERVPHVGHAGVLRDPANFPLWESNGWIDFLKDGRS
jgi:hypothetical protein